jgi:tRNA(His) 5'-end guanylyltransferase
MKFDDLDQKMRIYETAHDYCVLPGLYIVARLDGRSFTKLTKETLDYKRPFDKRFRDNMIATLKHLMDCGFRILYGYCESDEISLLFHPQENSFGRKTRKLNSILAGEASAKFSLLVGIPAVFDCRICELPTIDLVVDYFRWRNEDAHRNALNAYCYWVLRDQGKKAGTASAFLKKKSIADKNEFLFDNGINFNDVANWQKRGFGVYWQEYEKEGRNALTGKTTIALRKRLTVDLELPMKDAYSEFVRGFLLADNKGHD